MQHASLPSPGNASLRGSFRRDGDGGYGYGDMNASLNRGYINNDRANDRYSDRANDRYGGDMYGSGRYIDSDRTGNDRSYRRSSYNGRDNRYERFADDGKGFDNLDIGDRYNDRDSRYNDRDSRYNDRDGLYNGKDRSSREDMYSTSRGKDAYEAAPSGAYRREPYGRDQWSNGGNGGNGGNGYDRGTTDSADMHMSRRERSPPRYDFAAESREDFSRDRAYDRESSKGDSMKAEADSSRGLESDREDLFERMRTGRVGGGNPPLQFDFLNDGKGGSKDRCGSA
jgi:hypothetical protein